MIRSGVLAVMLVALTVPEAAHAGGFQLNEHGARAMAQAGAFAARASDGSALFFNPAGLSYQRGFNIMAGTTLIMPTYSFYGPINYNRNDEWKMKSNVFTPVNLYITNTWTDGMLKGLGLGIGVTTPYGLGTEWEDDWIGKAITREIDLKTFYIMPTISYAFNDFIAVGVGGNMVISSVSLRRAVTNFDPNMDLELEGTGDLAFSWNAGVLFRPVEQVSFGVTYRAQTDIDFTGTANFNPPASLAALFPGGDVTTALSAPATYMIGVAWMPTDNLELEVDYQGIQWSSYDKLAIDFKTDKKSNPTVAQDDVSSPKNYKNTFIIRAGGEYTLPVLGLKLRAGYLYDRNPVPDEHLEPLLPDADRHGLNIGFGMKVWSNITLDVSYLHLIFADRKTTSTSFPDGVYLDGMYRGDANLYGINFTYSF
jgi:long-chain fatty acid transport protein